MMLQLDVPVKMAEAELAAMANLPMRQLLEVLAATLQLLALV